MMHSKNDLRETEAKKQEQYEKSGNYYEFERYGELPHMAFYLRFRSEAIADVIRARVGPRDGLRILDVGCGTGVNLPYLCQEFPRATIVGIDLTARMLDHAKEKVHDLPSKVHLCRASCFELPCANASVDTVISTRFIHQFSYDLKKAAYREFRRVVKPGGIIIVEFYARVYALLHYLVPRKMAWWRKPDAPQNAPPEDYFRHFPSHTEVRDIVGSKFECLPVRPALSRLVYRVFGEANTRGITRALRYDPLALLYSEYLAISER